MHRSLTPIAVLLCAALGAFTFTGCGGGGSSGGGNSTSGFSNFDLLVTDAPVDDLLAFQVTIDEVHVVQQGGGETANLLTAPVTLELKSLSDSHVWLASTDLPDGTYTGLRVHLAPGSVLARRNDGSDIAVTTSANEFTTDFSSPITMTATTYRKVLLDLDVDSSLGGSTLTPPLTFAPTGTAIVQASSQTTKVEDVRGVVSSSDVAASTVVLNAFADLDAAVPLGEVLVRVPSNADLIQDDGTAFATRQDFFSALVDGQTDLLVRGSLLRGAITATRITVIDNVAGGGEANLVRLRGMAIDLGAGNVGVSIAGVPQGSANVETAFGGTIPETVTVTLDADTVVLGSNGQVSTLANVAPGSFVDVTFPQFTTAPFTASHVEIENEVPTNLGTITSVSGLPGTVTVNFDEMSPAVLSGQVATSTTNVPVTLTGSQVVLGGTGATTAPVLPSASLLTGLQVNSTGLVAGSAGAPTLAPTTFSVRPGELQTATVSAVNTGANTFSTTGGTFGNPFGAGVGLGPQTITLAPNATFTGAATTQSAFFDNFSTLSGTQTMQVQVLGLGTGNANEIQAFNVNSTITP